MIMRIIEANDEHVNKAGKLVSRCFPYRSFLERMSFWAYKNKHKRWIKKMMKWIGILDIVNIWVAVDESNNVWGTIGLYSCVEDYTNSIWLFWFCVDPSVRGHGIGKRLLELSISSGKKMGKRYLRLYTSNLIEESIAQNLYNCVGLNVVKEERKIF